MSTRACFKAAASILIVVGCNFASAQQTDPQQTAALSACGAKIPGQFLRLNAPTGFANK